jgi:hypothetical protein
VVEAGVVGLLGFFEEDADADGGLGGGHCGGVGVGVLEIEDCGVGW